MAITTANGMLNSQATMQIHKQSTPLHYSHHNDEVIFSGYVRVEKLLNGYVVHFSRNEGDITLKYVALTIKEVNDIITSEMVQFKLESLDGN
jgi:hypothetical protein